MGYCDEQKEHTLLLKCFISSFKYIRRLGWASDIVYKPCMVHNVSLQMRSTLKFWRKLRILGSLSVRHITCLCCMERHALLLKYAMTSPIYIRHSKELSRDIYMLSMVYIMRFLPRSTLNFHTNFHILSSLSVLEIAWCAERRDIH